MDLQPHVDTVRRELGVAARAGGDDAAALADRLTAPLESALRLVLLQALSAAADEITRDLAPGSVEVRLRGVEPEFVVTPPTAEADHAPITARPPTVDDEGGTWRVTLRLPEALRSHVEAAARRDGTSLNAWLVRAAASAVEPSSRQAHTGRRITGWVR